MDAGIGRHAYKMVESCSQDETPRQTESIYLPRGWVGPGGGGGGG